MCSVAKCKQSCKQAIGLLIVLTGRIVEHLLCLEWLHECSIIVCLWSFVFIALGICYGASVLSDWERQVATVLETTINSELPFLCWIGRCWFFCMYCTFLIFKIEIISRSMRSEQTFLFLQWEIIQYIEMCLNIIMTHLRACVIIECFASMEITSRQTEVQKTNTWRIEWRILFCHV